MSNLSDLQEEFQNYILQSDAAIFQQVISTEKISADFRLAIYKNAYYSRLVEALSANYPILQIFLGYEEFEKLASSYIKTYPSFYRSIRWFGDQLENFISQHPDYQQFAFLSELAKIEWTMTLVFDAADSPVVVSEMMMHIPPEEWETMRFRAHPSAHLVSLSWNVIPIWLALSHNEKPPEPVLSEDPVCWMFWRQDLVNQFCSLSSDEAYAINAMLQGSTFGEICEGLCQWVDVQNAAMCAASFLKGWIASGLISEIILTN